MYLIIPIKKLLSYIFISLAFSSTSLFACPCVVDDPDNRLAVNDQVNLQSIELSNQQTFDSESIDQDKIAILFWASWCPVCRKELESPELLSELFKRNEIYLLGISLDYDEDAAEQYMQSKNLDFPNAFISFDILDSFKQVKALPKLVIVDKSGMVTSVSNPINIQQIADTLQSLQTNP